MASHNFLADKFDWYIRHERKGKKEGVERRDVL